MMADIHSIGGPGGVNPSRPEKNQNTNHANNKGPSFSDVLNKTSHAGGAGHASDTPAAGNTSSIPPTYIGPVESASSVRETVHQASDEFFRLLDSFQSELGNPASSLKDIAPMMRDMETYRDQLMNEISALPQDDPGKGLLEEMIVMITSESAKFHRGDYI